MPNLDLNPNPDPDTDTDLTEGSGTKFPYAETVPYTPEELEVGFFFHSPAFALISKVEIFSEVAYIQSYHSCLHFITNEMLYDNTILTET